VQLIAEKEILIVVSLVHCCAIKNVVVASQLYDVADIQFTVEKKCPLKLLNFIQKYNLGNSVPNIVIMLRIFLKIAVSAGTCEKSFSKLKLIKDYHTLDLIELCPTQMAYRAKNHVTVLTRAAH